MSLRDKHKLPPDGTIVRATRLGWDEELDPMQVFDMEPYSEHGYESDDLEGQITSWAVNGRMVVLVNKQEADPKTVVAVTG
jgi:hypothetical protein